MAAVFLLVAPGAGVIAVFSDGDAATAGAERWPRCRYLLRADTTQSILLPDPLALAPLPKKSPPVTIRFPCLSHFSL